MSGPESFAMMIAAGFAGSTVFILARAIARRIEGYGRQPAAIPQETSQRIERMERAIESVAIEIERISESQRFLTKVMTERERAALPRGVTLE
ncbi:MAG: hypothetical protein ACHQQ3_12180 [Gemmatimonadales bacterium]